MDLAKKKKFLCDKSLRMNGHLSSSFFIQCMCLHETQTNQLRANGHLRSSPPWVGMIWSLNFYGLWSIRCKLNRLAFWVYCTLLTAQFFHIYSFHSSVSQVTKHIIKHKTSRRMQSRKKGKRLIDDQVWEAHNSQGVSA